MLVEERSADAKSRRCFIGREGDPPDRLDLRPPGSTLKRPANPRVRGHKGRRWRRQGAAPACYQCRRVPILSVVSCVVSHVRRSVVDFVMATPVYDGHLSQGARVQGSATYPKI